MVLGKLDHFLTPYTKINSEWIKDVNMRPETVRLSEENRQPTLRHRSQQHFLGSVSPGKGNKRNKQTGRHQAETVNKKERQPTEWERVFPNDTSNMGLIARL